MSKEHLEYIKKIKSEVLKITIFRIAILVIFVVLWEVLAQLKILDPFLTSSPSRILESLISFIKE